MADLTISNVRKEFGETTILHEVSLAIKDGEFLVLVGPSGCGKSTLLRMIAGLETVTSGEIAIGDLKANDLPPQKRNIAMVFQSYALFPHMTTRENIAYGPKLRGESKDEIARKIENAAAILNLTPYLDRYPRQLSGGQRQRVAMGRAIVREPSLFLFDEPLSNLDAQLRVQMRTEIKALHQKLRRTTVYVTHDQVEAMTLADRIVVMNAGRIEQFGSPLELYDNPASLFVARFIGSPSMNILEGRASFGAKGPEFRIGDQGAIPLPADARIRDGQSVSLGMRPEHLTLTDGSIGLPMRVRVVEQTGADTYVYGSVFDQPVVGLFHARQNLLPDAIVHVAPDGGQLHLFDPISGIRL